MFRPKGCLSWYASSKTYDIVARIDTAKAQARVSSPISSHETFGIETRGEEHDYQGCTTGQSRHADANP